MTSSPTPKAIKRKEDEIIVSRIRRARKHLSEAKKVHCTCSGTTLHYQGCSCGKLREIRAAQSELTSAIKQA